ncbi:MAG: 2OG-Fe(II) oxygenase [Brevundimonas sp.]|uniref:prolyl hydroxylase family protein n=1 Tax=Brevundimonas sp. TaxID=1871086 RepID=UPI00272614F2|nr:2OG-Fe(II) oxygenase [Brevundimonas sp.]MDO9586363.1 2OG-Fe(II) oxygenase [Brevundimonas sp.]MDP3371136.1 2OG-Fe(II) oxygenase [Brevundimonas sp.]MDP3658206.1 2OG-Fe(II) oxygenase [Brevundimonas sp.]MDZ4108004.1 2OG-Fe(II) oxygenase [Brevundimonas sp.]
MTAAPVPIDPIALSEAARRGDGGAAHRLAVLSAMGLGVPHDWRMALDWLAKAAGAGHATAGPELDLLSGRSAGVDIAAWLASPPPRALSEGPAILAIDGFLPAEVCDWLRARAEALAEPALVYDFDTGRGRRESVRTNAAARFDLERMDVVLALVRERIARAAGLPVPGLEWSQVLHYAVGQSFDWHVDWLDPATPAYASDLAARGQRIATFLIFLNDDFDGGETAFEAGGLRHRGRKGDALLWANTLPDGSIDQRTRHAGLPPTRGEKWVLSQWLRGRAPRV